MIPAFNIGPGMAGVTPYSVEFLSSGEHVNRNADTKTFSGVSLGSPDGGRYIIVAFSCYDNIGDASLSISVTVAGVACVEAAKSISGGGSLTFVSWIGYAFVPAGTVGDIAIVIGGFSGSMASYHYSAFRAVGLSSPEPIATAVGVPAASVSINTAGASMAILATTSSSSLNGKAFTGGGNPTTPLATNFVGSGYDDAPLGGVDTYDHTQTSTQTFIAAVW